MLKAHAHAHIRVHRIRAFSPSLRILRQPDLAPIGLSLLARQRHNLDIRRVSARSSNRHIRAQLRARQHQRVANIVAVARHT